MTCFARETVAGFARETVRRMYCSVRRLFEQTEDVYARSKGLVVTCSCVGLEFSVVGDN